VKTYGTLIYFITTLLGYRSPQSGHGSIYMTPIDFYFIKKRFMYTEMKA